MTSDDRIHAVERFGFTGRQAAFLDDGDAPLRCLPAAAVRDVRRRRVRAQDQPLLRAPGEPRIRVRLPVPSQSGARLPRPSSAAVRCHRPTSEPAPSARSGGLRHASADAARRRPGGARGDLARRSSTTRSSTSRRAAGSRARACLNTLPEPVEPASSRLFPDALPIGVEAAEPSDVRLPGHTLVPGGLPTVSPAPPRPPGCASRVDAPARLRSGRAARGGRLAGGRRPRSRTASSASLTVPDAASNGARSATATVISLPWLPHGLVAARG